MSADPKDTYTECIEFCICNERKPRIEEMFEERLNAIHKQLSTKDLVSEMRKDLVNCRKRWYTKRSNQHLLNNSAILFANNSCTNIMW